MSNTPITRKYKGADAEMTLSCATIVEVAIAHREFLESKRPSWNEAYFDTLRLRIDDITRRHLGKDNAKDLRSATLAVNTLIGDARTQLSELKVQIEEDFKKTPARRDEILQSLGLHTSVPRHNQSALIAVLFRINQYLTPELRAEIIAAGTGPEAIDPVLERAAALYEANKTQEFYKASRKELTQSAIQELNELYSDIMSICKIAARFYKKDPVVRKQFSFSAALAALSASATPATKAARKALAKIDPAATTTNTAS